MRDLGIEPPMVVMTLFACSPVRLFACCAAFTIAGVVAAWFEDQQQLKYRLFELNTEANVPTWFSAAQLVLAALPPWRRGCSDGGRRDPRDVRRGGGDRGLLAAPVSGQ